MKAFFALLWLVGLLLFVYLLTIPVVTFCFWAISLESTWQHRYSVLALGLPLALLLGPVLLLLVIAVIYRFMPRPDVGYFHMFSDRSAVLWALNNWPSTLYLKWFQSTFFLNDYLRYLILKAMGCDVRLSSWICSNVHLSDLRNLHIAEGALVGEFATIAPSYQPKLNHLVIGDIYIGRHTLIGGACTLGPETRIGDHCRLNYRVMVLANVNIKDRVIVGAHTKIFSNCTIGVDVKIGKNCVISSNTIVPDGSVIKDGATYSNAVP